MAAILGILILLLCIVLFVPVRYEAAGRSEESIQSVRGRLVVTWFLRLVRLDVNYKDQCLKWRIRIAWVKKTGAQKTGGQKIREQKKEEDGDEKTGSEEAEPEKNEEIPEESGEDKERAKKSAETAKGLEEPEKAREGQEAEQSEKSEECGEKGEESVEEAEKESPGDEESGEEGKEDRGTEKRTGFLAKVPSVFKGILEKIKGTIQKIKEAFQKICGRIKDLREKKDKILEFLRDESHVKAFHKGKKEVFKLLKRLNPRKVFAEVLFGFEDPSVTGQVLAGLGILYPFLGDHVAVTPDFERRVLKGRIEVKGKVCGYYFLFICWNLFWSRHIRRTYRDIKNFEF